MGTGFWKCIVGGLILAICMTLLLTQPGFATEPGTLKWSYQTGSLANFSPAIGSDGTIYVAAADNNLYALNRDGTLKWIYQTGKKQPYWTDSSPAIGADGTIYVSTDISLYTLNPDGTLKWRYNTVHYINSSPAIGPNGTIYVGSYGAKLYALDSSSLGLADSPWPMFHHDVRHTGRVES